MNKTHECCSYLKRRQVLLIQLRDGIVEILVPKRRADLAINKATLDLIPVLGAVDPLLQPVRIVPKPVLLVPFLGKHFAGAFVGDGEGEDGESEQDDDEEEHDEEVDPEEPRDSAAGADEAGERDQHEENAENDDGLVQKLLALGAALLAQPHSGYDDRD